MRGEQLVNYPNGTGARNQRAARQQHGGGVLTLVSWVSSQLTAVSSPAAEEHKAPTHYQIKPSQLSFDTEPDGTIRTLGCGGETAGVLSATLQHGGARVDVAVKRLNCKPTASREFRYLLNARHVNIVEFFGYTERTQCENDSTFDAIVLRRYTRSMAEYIKERRASDMVTNLRMALDVGDALAYLHERENGAIAHGDLKPANVMLDDANTAYLCDFGGAHGFSSDVPVTRVTTDRYYCRDESGPPADMHAFGKTMLELFSAEIGDTHVGRSHITPLISQCVASDPAVRCSAKEAVVVLREALAAAECRVHLRRLVVTVVVMLVVTLVALISSSVRAPEDQGTGVAAVNGSALFLGPKRVAEHCATKASCDAALHTAIVLGKSGAVPALLAHGASVDAMGADGNTALHIAILRRNPVAVEILLAHGANATAWDSDGRPALLTAIFHGEIDIARVLLTRGAKVDVWDSHGASALHMAVYRGNADAVNLLLAHGANVSATDSDYRTALHLAAFFGIQVAVKEILAHSANIDAKDGDGRTALHYAVAGGHTDVVTTLLAHGAKIDVTDSDGSTALRSALLRGNNDVVTKLLWHGADVDATDSNGRTALHSAIASGQTAIVSTLLAYGANVDAKDGDSLTALHTAIAEGQTSVVPILLLHGANVNATDSDGHTALHMAAFLGSQGTIEELLSHGADVDAMDFDGHTALHTAIAKGQTSVVPILLLHGANVDVKDREGRSALHYAVLRGNTDAAEELLANSADVDAKSSDGLTALHIAIASDRIDIALVLLVHGASVNATDSVDVDPDVTEGAANAPLVLTAGYRHVPHVPHVPLSLAYGATVSFSDFARQMLAHKSSGMVWVPPATGRGTKVPLLAAVAASHERNTRRILHVEASKPESRPRLIVAAGRGVLRPRDAYANATPGLS